MKGNKKGCTCPVSDLLPPVYSECPVQIKTAPEFSTIRFYGKSLIAIDFYGQYLGQWKFFKELGEIVITKKWYKSLVFFDEVTGSAEFFEAKGDNDMIRHDDIVMIVKVPCVNLKETIMYCEDIDFNK